jgi:hypothetical protein
VLHQRARHCESAAVAPGQRREALDGEIEIEHQRIDRGAQFEHQGGVDDILAGGAPMHETRRLRVARGHRLRQRIHHGNGDVAGGGGRIHQRRDVVVFSVASLAIAAAPVAEMTPTAPSARAKALSKSSMRCRRAPSLMMARMAALA